MTPKERAVMQQALEALIEANVVSERYQNAEKREQAITALREVLERPVIQEQDSMFMGGYRIGLAEMREKCATVSEQGTGEAVQKTALELLLNERKRIAAAIQAIKFEGDTGFRPVSEMIAEHKQDPKKAAAIEKAKMRKATRAEKVAVPGVYEVPVEQAEQEPVGIVHDAYDTQGIEWKCKDPLPTGTPLYAAPVSIHSESETDSSSSSMRTTVRTKDLTDDEIMKINVDTASIVPTCDREE